MKLSAIVFAPLFVVGAIADPVVEPRAAETPVPGNSGLYYCKDPTHNPITLSDVSYATQPQKGKPFTILATGTSKKSLSKGTTISFNVKWGIIPAKKYDLDVCGEIQCPTKEFNVTKTVNLPGSMPDGEYTVQAEIQDSGHQSLTCVKGKINVAA